MAAGTLRERIRIERRSTADDGQGGRMSSWALVAAVWAEVKPKSGSEVTADGRLLSRAWYSVKIRRRTDIVATDRIVWAGRTLNIRSVGTVAAHVHYQTIEAEEGTPE